MVLYIVLDFGFGFVKITRIVTKYNIKKLTKEGRSKLKSLSNEKEKTGDFQVPVISGNNLFSFTSNSEWKILQADKINISFAFGQFL